MISQYKNKKITDEYLYNYVSKEDFEDYFKYQSDDISDDIKYVIINKLDVVERNIILLYININGYQKLAQELGVSVGTAYKKVQDIRQKIRKYLK